MSRNIPALLLVACIAGCSNSPVDSTSYKPNYANGKSIYASQCRSCHDTGKQGAPSIEYVDAWDRTTLFRPGIIRQHLEMKLLQGAGAAFSAHDEADVCYYIDEQLGDREEAY